MEQLSSVNIPLLGKRGKGKVTIVDGDYDGEYFGQYKWYLNPSGYVYRYSADSPGRISYLHHEVCWVPAGMWRDHKNRNKLDNRSCNLRPITPKLSAANTYQRPRQNKTGYRGVQKPYTQSKDGQRSYYKGFIAICNKKRLGTFKTAAEAAQAYDREAKRQFGDLAVLNLT